MSMIYYKETAPDGMKLVPGDIWVDKNGNVNLFQAPDQWVQQGTARGKIPDRDHIPRPEPLDQNLKRVHEKELAFFNTLKLNQ